MRASPRRASVLGMLYQISLLSDFFYLIISKDPVGPVMLMTGWLESRRKVLV